MRRQAHLKDRAACTHHADRSGELAGGAARLDDHVGSPRVDRRENLGDHRIARRDDPPGAEPQCPVEFGSCQVDHRHVDVAHREQRGQHERSDGAGADQHHSVSRLRAGAPRCVEADRERLRKARCIQRHAIGDASQLLLGGRHVLGHPPVDVEAVRRIVPAQVGATLEAARALAAPDPRAGGQPVADDEPAVRPDLDDLADELVAEDQRSDVTTDRMRCAAHREQMRSRTPLGGIGAADAASQHPEQHLALAADRRLPVLDPDIVMAVVDRRLHRRSPRRRVRRRLRRGRRGCSGGTANCAGSARGR